MKTEKYSLISLFKGNDLETDGAIIVLEFYNSITEESKFSVLREFEYVE